MVEVGETAPSILLIHGQVGWMDRLACGELHFLKIFVKTGNVGSMWRD
jgi:hypothetical protein